MNALNHRALDPRESGDGYRGELYRLGQWRVALCRDGIQYLLQRQRPRKAGVVAAWDSISYCGTRAALSRLWQQQVGEAGEIFARLPEYAKRLDLSAWQATQTNT